ncbi:PaaX family transcriptional regulator C-terminal domain-containing protein [Rhodococcus sp. IEGM 1343]|uniref:PaaX family transcriptional regulator n=1 Tax=Rhodococcus sp. IEGM 1343 TaxID=3082224 RepID=UPI0029536044|nr:PaaX family transcriptional regulator C-terminal domain-containing protein [Rhodococcus sp. IEGM 1343]MDV8058386.1 PaaX family transcriptional regulator C-terminal domain-containing protein [Rhodococcus sp. IEGM 1343]
MTNSAPSAAGAILDDFDSRPGSATSLVRTVLGAYVRPLGGWFAIADVVVWMDALGVPPESTRIAVARLKKKGVVVSSNREGRTGYRITEQADAMFARGDGRIFGFRRMADGDPFRLISFTIPETQRAARHQLRRRLTGIGCGTVSPGLWIAPDYLAEEAGAIVDALELSPYVTTFVASEVAPPTTLRESAAQWWDLAGIADRHRAFLAAYETVAPARNPRDAFVTFATLLDEWRVIPYVDPGLPPSMTPEDWPGTRAVATFEGARGRYLEVSREWVAS